MRKPLWFTETKITLEELVKANGFTSEKEFHSMVASVPLTSPGARGLFTAWQDNNGTKAGLQKIIEIIKNSEKK
jgi:hypothetical protein